MSIFKTKKFVAAFAGLTLAAAMTVSAAVPVSAAALTPAQVSAIISLLQSFGADQSTINNVQASLTGGTPTGGTTTTTGYTFNVNLTIGSKGADVMNLQKVLNSDSATMVAATGAGSPGLETSTFGPLTQSAVIKFQKKYGITPAVGYVGPVTRAKLNSMGGTTTGGTTTTPPVSVGTGLMVSGGTQPAAQLAPLGAARVPFTNITFTAGNDGDVTVNGVVVQRGGPSTDAAFSGIVLLDEQGNQIGTAKTLNSAHQATLAGFTVPKGTSRTLTVAANRRTTDASSVDAGAVANFSVVAVNTSATVNGSLPIIGTNQTLNNGLTIGSVTVARGPLDPAAQSGGVSKNVGTTGYTFSSVKVTAGSTEDVLVKSIRWNQASSTSSSDLANVVTVVDGVSYPTTVDSTGKYYTSNFGSGITIAKGFSKEISIKGDIVSGSGRTIAFNIEKTTDLNVTGVTYGYGITPPTSGTGFSAGTIWYAGSTISVNSGTLIVTTDPGVAAQNVAINLANQPLGGYQVEVKGEPISVASMVFGLDVVGPADNITNVTLVDQNGAVLAGPVDQSAGIVTFSDTITFPVGVTKLALKGKLGTSFLNNNTIRASTTPSTNWTTVTGQVTNTTITPSPSSVLQANSMTVKSAALTVSTLPSPLAQTVVAGGQSFTFANFTLDAGASGEDLRISQIALAESGSGTASNLTNCQIWDGSTALNTGSNALSSAAAGSNTFTFDAALIVPKGTTKTLTLKCNISSSATGTYAWGLTTSPTATGQTSGQSATVTLNSSTGQIMTMTTGGTLAVTLDSSSPSYRVVAAGTTGNTVSVLRVRATNEDMDLQTVGLQLTSSATSTNADVTQVTLWDGTTQIGTAVFDGTDNSSHVFIATSTLTTTLRIPANTDKLITVKVDLPNQGISEVGHPGALIAIDYDAGNAQATKALGVSSGTAVYAAGSDTAASGLRVFKSFPSITYSSTGGSAITGVNDLISLQVTADAKGDVRLQKLTFTVSTSTASLTGNAVTFSGPNGNVSSSTNAIVQSVATGAADVTVYFDSTSNTQDRTVAAGTTKNYTLRGTIALTGSTNTVGSISTALKADASYPALPYNVSSTTEGWMASSTQEIGGNVVLSDANIVWSPQSTTTSVTTSSGDWTNGYGLPGCFTSSGLGQNCTARVLAK